MTLCLLAEPIIPAAAIS